MAGWKSADKGKSIVTGFYIEKKDTNSFNKNIKPTLISSSALNQFEGLFYLRVVETVRRIPEWILRKKEFFLIVDLCFVCTPDHHTHDDAENSPYNEVGSQENDKQCRTDDGSGNDKATQDN